jgi:hypothetical protein
MSHRYKDPGLVPIKDNLISKAPVSSLSMKETICPDNSNFATPSATPEHF